MSGETPSYNLLEDGRSFDECIAAPAKVVQVELQNPVDGPDQDFCYHAATRQSVVHRM